MPDQTQTLDWYTRLARVEEIVGDIKINRDRDYEVQVGSHEGRIFIQILCQRPDTYTGEFGTGYGGPRYLRDDMTDSEIVRTVFGALLAYEEHETREGFTYKGVRIYGPHIDVEALVEAGKHIEERP